jgi:hypothetical protein
LVYLVAKPEKKFENGMAVRKGSSRTIEIAFESAAAGREAQRL